MRIKSSLICFALVAGLTSTFSCSEQDPDTDDSGAEPSAGEEPKASGEKPSAEDEQDSGKKDTPEIDCSKLEPTGTDVGEIPPDVTLKDANGNDVSLHEHCNSIVYVIAGTAG